MVIPLNVKIEKTLKKINLRFKSTSQSHYSLNELQPSYFELISFYRSADKSLARPGRKQATVTEDFDVHISYLLS